MSHSIVALVTLFCLCSIGTLLSEAHQLYRSPVSPIRLLHFDSVAKSNGNPIVFPDLSAICSHLFPFLKSSLPAFLRNVSAEGMQSFCAIVTNATLTKREVKVQLEQWAKQQGNDVYEKFEEFVKLKEGRLEAVSRGMEQLFSNALNYTSDMFDILSDPDITFKQEVEKVYNITEQADPLVLLLVLVARAEVKHMTKSKQHLSSPIGDLFGQIHILLENLVPHIGRHSHLSLNTDSIAPQFWIGEGGIVEGE